MSDSQDEISLKKGFADRLREQLHAKKMSQVDLERLSGVGSKKISDYSRGAAMPAADVAIRLAKALEVRPEWLILGTNEKSENAGRPDFHVPIIEAKFAAGAGVTPYLEQLIGFLPLSDELLRQMGMTSTEGLCVVEALGDSMYPTFQDRSKIVINRLDTRLREGVFAFRLGDDLRIKRLRPIGLDAIHVISDNPIYEAETYSGEILNHFEIFGHAKLAITLI